MALLPLCRRCRPPARPAPRDGAGRRDRQLDGNGIVLIAGDDFSDEADDLDDLDASDRPARHHGATRRNGLLVAHCGICVTHVSSVTVHARGRAFSVGSSATTTRSPTTGFRCRSPSISATGSTRSPPQRRHDASSASPAGRGRHDHHRRRRGRARRRRRERHPQRARRRRRLLRRGRRRHDRGARRRRRADLVRRRHRPGEQRLRRHHRRVRDRHRRRRRRLQLGRRLQRRRPPRSSRARPRCSRTAIDEDCDGRDNVNLDRDGDGFPRPVDCDDGNPASVPTRARSAATGSTRTATSARRRSPSSRPWCRTAGW